MVVLFFLCSEVDEQDFLQKNLVREPTRSVSSKRRARTRPLPFIITHVLNDEKKFSTYIPLKIKTRQATKAWRVFMVYLSGLEPLISGVGVPYVIQLHHR